METHALLGFMLPEFMASGITRQGRQGQGNLVLSELVDQPVTQPLSLTLQFIFKALSSQVGTESCHRGSKPLTLTVARSCRRQTREGNPRPATGSNNLCPNLNKVRRREEHAAHSENFSAPRKARDKPDC